MSVSDLTNQEKLEEIYEMTKENNNVLLGMRRQQHVANAFRFLYWIIILVSLGGAYYYIKPVVDSVNKNRAKVDDTLKQFETLRSGLGLPAESKFLDQVMQGIKNSAGVATTTN